MKTTITVERLAKRGYLSFSVQFQRSFRTISNDLQLKFNEPLSTCLANRQARAVRLAVMPKADKWERCTLAVSVGAVYSISNRLFNFQLVFKSK